MALASAPVSAAASATVSKTGRSRCVVPPFPGVTLLGNGQAWWDWRKNEGEPYRATNNQIKKWGEEGTPLAERVAARENFHWCPTFIAPYNSKNILIEGLTLIDGPFWNVVPVYCENVTVRGLTIRNLSSPIFPFIRPLNVRKTKLP